jgi:hypothetical protein
MYTNNFRRAMLGDTALLSLDFTAGTVPTAVTFTRADSTARATYIDASGYVKTVTAAGAARFDYTGGVAKGLLIEAAATNIIRHSNAFTSGDWYLGGTPATLTSNYAVGPDGVTGSAWRFQGALTNSVFAQPVSNGAAAHLVSIYAKSNTGSNQTFTVYNGSSGTTCTATSVWQRFQVSVAGGWAYAYFGTLGTNQDIQIWGAQSEVGASTASSYIPTGASALTRLADDAVIRSTAWTSLYAQPGAMVVEFYRGAYGAGDRSIMSTDPTAARHWHLKQANASATAQIAFSTGSPVTQTGLVSGLNKVAIAWNAPTPTASFDLCVNGATPTFGGSNVGTTLSTWLTLGSQSTTGVSGSGTWDSYLNNSIKSVKYYSALTYAEMIAKTK